MFSFELVLGEGGRIVELEEVLGGGVYRGFIVLFYVVFVGGLVYLWRREKCF